MENCIAIDWLQLYCHTPLDKVMNSKLGTFEPVLKSRSGSYEVCLQDYSIRQFKNVYEIKKDNEVLAVITCNPPANSVLKQETAIVKIINRCLYQKELKKFVLDMLKDLNLTFISVSRIDICVDFLKFDNGMTGNELIKKFVSEKFIKSGKQTSWTLHADSGVRDEGKTRNFLNYHYLRFGKKGGECNYYIYNKSKELAEVKTKPYIIEHWESCGYEENQGDVWRMEFSLKSGNNGVVHDGGEGEVLDLKNLSILEPLNYTAWFINYFDRHFKFYKNDGKKRKDRNREIKLFKNLKPSTIKIKLSRKKDSGRRQRTFAKQLNELNQELRNDVPSLGMMADDLLRFYISQYSLESYASKRLGIKDTNYQNPIWEKYYEVKCLEKQERINNDLLELIFGNTLFGENKAPAITPDERKSWGINLGTEMNF